MNRHQLAAYFTPKALTKANAAIDAISASLAQGFWIKGASRSARAAFAGKFNAQVAKLGRAFRAAERAAGYGDKELHDALWHAEMALAHGDDYILRARDKLPAKLASFPGVDGEGALSVEHFADLRAFLNALAPVIIALDRLDATRPPPVFTIADASPTVTKTLTDLGATSAKVCPIRWVEVARKDRSGRMVFERVGYLDWPPGTQHGTGRFGACSRSDQCEACSHAIRNPFNWIPMLLDTPAGPRSLWTGRDCAKTLFGVDYDGVCELAEGPGARALAKEAA